MLNHPSTRAVAALWPAALWPAALWLAALSLGTNSLSCSAPGPHSSPPAVMEPPAGQLRRVEDFAAIADPAARSAALFVEMSRVLLHPRCVNCHPSGDVPLQGDQGMLHEPPALRGADDEGVVGMRCGSCHQDGNVELARVPGALGWKLAPRSMAWEGGEPGAICEQLKDPKRNGGRALAQLVEHSEHDALVAWGWSPGHGRRPPPGSQAAFAALVAAWVKDGAACPPQSRTQGSKP